MNKGLLAAAALAAACSLASAQEGGERLLKVFDKGKQGLADTSGRAVIAVKYDYIDPDFNEGLARFRSGGRFGYVDRAGKEAIPATFEGAADFSGGIALVIQGGRYGFIDRAGKFVFKPQFDSVGRFVGDFVVVSAGGKYGVAHRGGRMVLPCEYDSARIRTRDEWDYNAYLGYKADDLAVIYASEGEEYVEYRSFVARPDGSAVFEAIDGGVDLFYEGFAVYSLGGKNGYIGRNGRIAVIPQYDSALPFNDGVAWVQTAEGWGLIDARGETVIPNQYIQQETISTSLSLVKAKNGKWGAVSGRGKLVAPCEYQSIERGAAQSHNVLLAVRSSAQKTCDYDFFRADGSRIGQATCLPWNWNSSEGFLFLTEEGTSKTICIGKDGASVVKLSGTGVQEIGLIEGRSLYRYLEGGLYGILDEKLRVLVAPLFTDIGWADSGCVPVHSGALRSSLRFDGGRMASYPYERVCDFSDLAFRVYAGGKQGFMRRSDGAIVTEPVFDAVWNLSEGMALVAAGYSDGNPYSQGWNEASGMKFDMIENRGFDKGKFGYVDASGALAIKPVFDCAYDFSGGFAVVRIGDFYTGKRSYIDKKGRMLVNPSFNYAYSFENGVACVVVDEKVGYIDTTGRFILRPSL